ncbi:MAG: hypothetical protein R3C61_15905 [Bacteroidia bacterium]
MVKSKFIRLYLQLDKPARRTLKKWVQSPVHNQHEEVRLLFQYIDTRKALSAVSLRKERVFEYLFPGKQYDDAKLRTVQNLAYEVLQKFVGYYYTLSHPFYEEIDITRGLITWDQPEAAGNILEKVRSELYTLPELSESVLLQRYQVEQIRFTLSGTQTRAASNNLPELFEALSAFFVQSTLRYACIAASHTHVSASRYDIPLLPQVLEAVEKNTWKNHPAILLYYHAYLALSQAGTQHFPPLKSAFASFRQYLPSDEQQEILLLAINTCIKQLNMGEEVFAREAFELYQRGLETSVLLDGEQLSRFTYKNIVSISLKLGEYAWTRQFIESYTARLETHFRDSYHHYNLARLYFAQGEHAEARRLLTRITAYDDVFFDLGVRMLLLKVYYEAGETDALEALFVSFSRYLQRKKSLGYHKQVYQNIIRLARKILTLPPGDPETQAALREEINDTHPLAERSWLLGQLDKRI